MKTIASGSHFVRYELGDIGIVALHDGYVDMPPTRLRQEGGQPLGADLPSSVPLVGGRLRLSVNAFLVIGRDEHVLIDTGAANAWEPSMGLLLDGLAEAGIAREAIGTVALTHTHTDHIGGLVAADGSDAFPALRRLFIPEAEVVMFDAKARMARFRARRTPFGDGFAVSASVMSVQAVGHEIGHSAFQVSGGGETLLVWGDIVHVPSIQFARPELTWELDADQTQARRTRRAMLDQAARPQTFVAGAHLDFPGVGQVTRLEDAFAFTPI